MLSLTLIWVLRVDSVGSDSLIEVSVAITDLLCAEPAAEHIQISSPFIPILFL